MHYILKDGTKSVLEWHRICTKAKKSAHENNKPSQKQLKPAALRNFKSGLKNTR